ncbi:MAG: zinc dependent phospholipase C family protein [Oscillospiraceae bacterium]|nr:zinc dependent phospholipase C family protein [Oscillospiraceae bacterium]
MGIYLAEHYLEDIPQRYIRAFRVGCIEPDRNPATYLKGSLRCQWLRGHNYKNARRYMRTISSRLENKDKLNLLDFYTLGKLIHYTADAFTYAHNDTFTTKLGDHREYEVALQDHFLQYLEEDPQVDVKVARTIMEAIYSYHREYIRQPVDIHTDSEFALTACCCVLAILFTPRII